MTDPLRIIEPSAQWRDAFLDMATEVAAAGDQRYRDAVNDFTKYLQRLDQFARGEDLPEGRVRESVYWLVEEGTVIGSCRLRHALTPELYQEGGNIGYDIRPAKRRQGYGTALLALMLEQARELDFDRVLITCDTDNVASARIIEKNGGQRWDEDWISEEGVSISRYWIAL